MCIINALSTYEYIRDGYAMHIGQILGPLCTNNQSINFVHVMLSIILEAFKMIYHFIVNVMDNGG